MNLNKFYSRAFDYNVTLLKSYNNKKLKLINLNCCRVSGVETSKKYTKKNSVNTEKLLDNKIRAKNKILELSFCNDWDWFFTATLNPAKFDRTNLSVFHKQLTQWIRNYNKKYKVDIKFLLIPELHRDKKSWHMHGLLQGLPSERLSQFKIGDIMGHKLAEKVKNGEIIYNWIDYSKKFGFCDLEPIRNQSALSLYMTKYITKELIQSSITLGNHLYYHSRGLKTAELIKKGRMDWSSIQPKFQNDYCKISWFNYNNINSLLNKFI